MNDGLDIILAFIVLVILIAGGISVLMYNNGYGNALECVYKGDSPVKCANVQGIELNITVNE